MKTTLNEQTMIDLDALPPISATKVSDTKISATKYMNQYKKEKYDTVRIDFKKGSKSLLLNEATKRGISLTQMIKDALKLYLSTTNREVKNE